MLSLLCLAALGLAAGCTKPKPVEKETTAEPPKAPYQGPLVSPGAKFSQLPPAVQNTIRAQTGAAEIEDIQKETNQSGGITYEIKFENSEQYPPLFVAQDGAVLNTNAPPAAGAPPHDQLDGVGSSGPVTGASLEELPLAVRRKLREHAPEAEIASINKETWGSRTLYVVSFKDEAHHPKLYIAADGTVLNEGAR